MRKILTLFLLQPFFIYGESCIFFDENTKELKITKNQIELLTDSFGTFSIEDIVNSNDFKPSKNQVPTFFISNEWHWVKFCIVNKTNQPVIIEVDNITIEKIEAYLVSKGNQIERLDDLTWSVKPNNRKLYTHRNAWQLGLSKDSLQTLYFKIFKQHGTLKIPIKIWSKSAFIQSEKRSAAQISFFSGLCLVLSFLCVLAFYNTREKKYIYYLAYISSILIWRAYIEGFLLGVFQDFMPNYQNPVYGNVILAFIILFFLLFLRDFLLKKGISPPIHYKIHFLSVLYISVCILLIAFFGIEIFTFYWFGYLYLAGIVLSISISILFIFYGIQRKEQSAFIYFLSSLPLIAYTITTIGSNAQFFRSNWIFQYTLFHALIFEIIILCVGLAFDFKRFFLDKKQKEFTLLQTLQKEKERISRDLHDNVGGQLSFILYSLDDLEKEDRVQRNKTVHHMREAIKNSIRNLRETIWAINDQEIFIVDFSDKLKVYVRSMFKDEKIRIEFTEHISSNTSLNALVGINLYRICQEVVNNAFKHSKATELCIAIESTTDINIRIHDNGIGFSDEESSNLKFGLSNLKKRAQESGILFELLSIKNKGVSVSLTVKQEKNHGNYKK